METEHAKMTGDFDLDYSAHTLQYLQQLDSHDRTKKEYIYTIDDLDIENVAQTIMRGLKEGFSFKEVDWDTLENEATNENNDIACLIIFQAATPFSSRSEDRINARREKHPKVRNIIIVCIGRDRDRNHSKICSEKPFLMDHDIVFKYHIKADDSPHDCSRDVVGRIRLHLIIIVMGTSYDALLLKHVELETELEREKQLSRLLKQDLENSEKEKEKLMDENNRLHKENEKTSQQLEQAYQMYDRLREEYHKLKDQKTTGGDERK